MAREQGVASRQPGGSESLDRAAEARRATDYGLRTTDYGLRTTDYGAQRPDYGLWTTDYEASRTDWGHDLPFLGPGQVGVLTGDAGLGMTRLGLVLLSDHARAGPVAYLDVRGWLSPLAAWEVGNEPDRLVIARCRDVIRWGKAVASLLDGAAAVLAEVPAEAKDASIRKLAALARNRGTPLLLRPLDRAVPTGVAHLTLEARETSWSGAVDGHGRIERRRTLLMASGKAMRGMTRTIEMEDDGSNTLRVVSGVAAAETRSVAG